MYPSYSVPYTHSVGGWTENRLDAAEKEKKKKSLAPAKNRRPALILVTTSTELPPLPNASCKDAHQYVANYRGDVELTDELKRCALRKT